MYNLSIVQICHYPPRVVKKKSLVNPRKHLIELKIYSLQSQDESGAVETEARPTPTSPLLSSLLSKSPITGVPGAASSPLAQVRENGHMFFIGKNLCAELIFLYFLSSSSFKA